MHSSISCPIAKDHRARQRKHARQTYHGSLRVGDAVRRHLRQWRWCPGWSGVGGAGGGGGKDLGGRRGRKRTCPRCSNAAGLNTHAGTPRHASIAPEVPRKIILSPRLVPNALLLATSHLLNITSVSTIRMLAGVWAAVHARACAHLEATPTSSALQEQPRFKLEAWNRFCRKAPTLVLTSLRYLL